MQLWLWLTLAYLGNSERKAALFSQLISSAQGTHKVQKSVSLMFHTSTYSKWKKNK